MERITSVPEHRTWSVVQVLALLLTMEGALWSEGRAQAWWYLSALAVLVISILVSHPRASALGIGWHGLCGAAWTIPLAAALCAIAIAIAHRFGTLTLLRGPKPVYWHSIFYVVWALEQQFILNSFFYKRFEHLLGNTSFAVFITALLFGLVHLPNPVLVPFTFLGGLLFVGTFRRWRNIYPLAVAHAMFGLTLAITIPDHWIRHMRVGLSFLRLKVHS